MRIPRCACKSAHLSPTCGTILQKYAKCAPKRVVTLTHPTPQLTFARVQFCIFYCLKLQTQSSWTPEEDSVLCAAQRSLGNKWSEISRLLPGRAENAVKNRFNSLITKK